MSAASGTTLAQNAALGLEPRAPEAVQASRSVASLPSGFDPSVDGVLLMGARGEQRLSELCELGVARIVALGTEVPMRLSNVRAARSAEEAIALFLDFEVPPRNVIIERLPSGGYSVEEARALAAQVASSTANRATFAINGPIWVRHSFANFSQVASGRLVGELEGRFEGVPMFLVSPGPSLAKNIEALKAVRGRGLILCGNRGLRPLREAGITPDVVLVSDPLNLSYQVDGGLLEGVAALVLDIVAHPELCALPAERKFFFASVSEIYRSTLASLDDKSRLRGGGSVATVAVSFALYLGSRQITLVGQDLALNGSQYYVETAPDGDTRISLTGSLGKFENSSQALKAAMRELGTAETNSQQHFVTVPGYYGGQVQSSRQFQTYLSWFSSEAERHQGRVRFINATEGGARIDNMEQLPLTDVVAALPELPALASFPTEPTPLEQKRSRKRLEGVVQSQQKALAEVRQLAEECLRLARQALNSEAALGRLGDTEKRLVAALQGLPFLIALSAPEVEAARRAGANAKSLKESLAASERLFQVLERGSLACMPWLAEARRGLRK